MNNSMTQKNIPLVLTIAGSDSGGGAGIQTDLRTFHALGVFGASAITSITAQNPVGVSRIDPVPAEGVRAQIKAVFERLNVSAVKTGMLFSKEIAEAVCDELSVCKHGPVVVDPVMVSTSGHLLFQKDAIDVLCNRLFPLADWVTPNQPEAEYLTGMKLDSRESAIKMAQLISKKWNVSVVLKGGHCDSDRYAGDLICFRETGRILNLFAPRLALKPYSGHGTGCTLSSALAAFLASGTEVELALKKAKAYVYASLADPVRIGNDGNDIYAMYPPKSLDRALSLISTEELGS